MSNGTLTKQANIASWVAQLVAAAILAMSSVLKLSGNPDAVALFDTLAVEPWGRYLVGLAELTAVILLLRPRTAGYGGLLAMVIMMGALATHLLIIGIVYPPGDGDASLFIMAIVVMLAALGVVTIRRPRVFGLGAKRMTGP